MCFGVVYILHNTVRIIYSSLRMKKGNKSRTIVSLSPPFHSVFSVQQLIVVIGMLLWVIIIVVIIIVVALWVDIIGVVIVTAVLLLLLLLL